MEVMGGFYRVIRLENGLTACLISDSSVAPVVDEGEEEEDSAGEMTDSEMESENEEVESGNSVEEDDDSMPKKLHSEEQKMVRRFKKKISEKIISSHIIIFSNIATEKNHFYCRHCIL